MAKVLTFFGGDACVGTTMLAQSVAESLVKKDAKVLIVYASSELTNGYVKGTSEVSIDLLKRLDSIKEQDLKNVIVKEGRMDVINGPKNALEIMYFDPTILEECFEVLPKDYDYIVVDGGHNVHYPLVISALRAADKKFYVLDGNEKSAERFHRVYSDIISAQELNYDDDAIILNKNSREQSYSLDEIKKTYKCTCYAIPKVDGSHNNEITKASLYTKSGAFMKAIDELVDKIMKDEEEDKKGKR